MQYIKKQNSPPPDWDIWFTRTNGNRSFDYGRDNSTLIELEQARAHLLKEQHNLCAYCMRSITLENSSIEHVIPKSLNKELSTNYFNLVAVCLGNSANKSHCDKAKEDKLIPPIIFLSNSEQQENPSKNHYWFECYAEGDIVPKPTLSKENKSLAQYFINTLNLNHDSLKADRMEALRTLTEVVRYYAQSNQQTETRPIYINLFDKIKSNKKHPFRQFLLIYLNKKLGIS